MNFTLTGESLKPVIALMKLGDPKHDIPILQNVKITVNQTEIQWTVNTLAVTAVVNTPFISFEPSLYNLTSALLPGTLHHYLKNVTKQPWVMFKFVETGDCACTISTTSGAASVYYQTTQDYPESPTVETDNTFTYFDAGLFVAMTNKLIPFADSEYWHPERNKERRTIHFKKDGNGYLIAQATNCFFALENQGQQVSQVPMEPAQYCIKGFLALKALAAAYKRIPLSQINLGKSQFSFTNHQFTVISRRIEGSYPRLETVFPKEVRRVFSINKQTLLDAATECSKIHPTKMIYLNIGMNNVTAFTSSITQQYTVDILVWTSYNHNEENVEVRFNSELLIIALKAFNCVKIEIAFQDNISAFVLRERYTPENFVILMPVRCNPAVKDGGK